MVQDEQGCQRVQWIPERVVRGTPYDTPIPGYQVNNISTLRLWKAEACESFDFQAFNRGDYYGAVHEKVDSENLTKVLYPNDEQVQGKRLRLEQQYFFVSCSLQDMIRIHLLRGAELSEFHHKFAAQLNDTHPSIAIPELMRLLIDEHGMGWDQAWDITRNTFGYTNHTLLPEALEKWPVSLLGRLLPRHLEIIYEINRRFLEEARLQNPEDDGALPRLSLIDDSGEKQVRMAHLACVGSRAVNGVAELHTRLLKESVMRDFHDLTPEKFSNKTNGVTPRRWMLLSNPGLANLISRSIGEDWIRHLDDLRQLEAFVEKPDFREHWWHIKIENKKVLANYIRRRNGFEVNPESLFDVQVKRLHEYKRQHLNVLHLIHLYNQIKRDPGVEITSRTFIFGGKAAPGYTMAKLIIKLINSVADVVNNDPDVAGRLRVFFIPNFCVRNSQHIYPAADLSEQISTAGMEASGTGNMKFAMNGALTIGTLDGANIELREEVGAENFFLFGLTAEQVHELKRQGYNPRSLHDENEGLREVIDMISSGTFSNGDRELFKPLVDSLLGRDEYMVLADYQAYIDCQEEVGRAYRNQDHWTRMSILNVARMGKFSSDRAVREYSRDIWKVGSVPVELEDNPLQWLDVRTEPQRVTH